MADRTVLHLVADYVSPGRAKQIADQIRFLPQQLFTQHLAVAEISASRQIERRLLRKVLPLGRRLGGDLLASHKVRGLLARLAPDMVVCWDIPAAEQLRLALLAKRTTVPAVLMMFSPPRNRQTALRLETNYHHLSLHIVAASRRLSASLRKDLGFRLRTHVVPPCGGGDNAVDRSALRSQLGLTDADPLVFLSATGRPADRLQAIWGCAIVQRLYPKLRILMALPANGDAAVVHYHRLAKHVKLHELLITTSLWDEHTSIRAANLFVEPMSGYDEPLAMYSAFAQSVPVVATRQASLTLGWPAGQFIRPIAKNKPRWLATAVLGLVEDHHARQQLSQRARNWSDQAISAQQYRANIARLYQAILEARWQEPVTHMSQETT